MLLKRSGSSSWMILDYENIPSFFINCTYICFLVLPLNAGSGSGLADVDPNDWSQVRNLVKPAVINLA
jgi:hypothetical protein